MASSSIVEAAALAKEVFRLCSTLSEEYVAFACGKCIRTFFIKQPTVNNGWSCCSASTKCSRDKEHLLDLTLKVSKDRRDQGEETTRVGLGSGAKASPYREGSALRPGLMSLSITLRRPFQPSSGLAIATLKRSFPRSSVMSQWFGDICYRLLKRD